MKKILSLLLLLVCLSSCEDDIRKITLSQEEYDKLTGAVQGYPKPFHFKGGTYLDHLTWVIVLGEDNHEYLFDSNIGPSMVLIHSPECKLCQERMQIDTTNLINQPFIIQ